MRAGMWAVRLGYSPRPRQGPRPGPLSALVCVPNAQAKASMRLSTAWMPRSSYRARQRGKTCTEWGVGVTIWWLCACRGTQTPPRKGKANYTLPSRRLFSPVRNTVLGSTCCRACDAWKKDRQQSSWQVSRARPQQTLGRTNSGSHRGETRMVQHSDDGG